MRACSWIVDPSYSFFSFHVYSSQKFSSPGLNSGRKLENSGQNFGWNSGRRQKFHLRRIPKNKHWFSTTLAFSKGIDLRIVLLNSYFRILAMREVRSRTSSPWSTHHSTTLLARPRVGSQETWPIQEKPRPAWATQAWTWAPSSVEAPPWLEPWTLLP